MKIFSSRRPKKSLFGVPDDIKSDFRLVSLGNCEWDVVVKRGVKGTARQTVRQRSSKTMREGKYGRKTVRIKLRSAYLCDRETAKSIARESGITQNFVDSVTGMIESRPLTAKEAWDMLM
jgi:hypothetical protein